MISLKKLTRSARVAADIVARDVQLGPIARRQHDRLARGAARGERRERAGQPVHVKIDALAQFDRRGLVTDSDEEQMHAL